MSTMPPTDGRPPLRDPRYALDRPTSIVLRALTGRDAGRVFELGERQSITGGSSAIHPIHLTDDSVAPSHFQLLLSRAGVELRDLGCSSGTRVELSPVPEHGLILGGPYRGEMPQFSAGAVLLELVETIFTPYPESSRDSLGLLYGSSPPLRLLYSQIEEHALSGHAVMILGERGVPRRETAQTIHALSGSVGPFVDLLQFTVAQPRGSIEQARESIEQARESIEQARGGTWFAPEFAAIPSEIQWDLCEAVEQGEVRLICGSTVPPELAVTEGVILPKLFHCAMDAVLYVPPLQWRLEDIPWLAKSCTKQIEREIEQPRDLTELAVFELSRNVWSFNDAQLKSIVRHAAIMAECEVITDREIRRALDGWLKTLTWEPYDREQVLDPVMLRQDHQARFYCITLLELTQSDIRKAAELADLTIAELRELLLDLHNTRHGPGIMSPKWLPWSQTVQQRHLALLRGY